MTKNKNLKRKPTPFIKAKQKETEDADESASEQEVNSVCVGRSFPLSIFFTFWFDSRN